MVIVAENTEHIIMRRQTLVADPPIVLDHQTDQRQTQRHEISQPVIVSVLGTASQSFHGELRNVSEGGAQILLNQPLRCASLVTIDYDDNCLLGEVVYCQKEQADWLVGIRVEYALLGLATLASIADGQESLR
jgi:PilZ domain